MEKGRISAWQLMVLMLLFTLGDTILVLPSYMTAYAGRDAWLSGSLTVCAGLTIILLFTALASRYPAMTMVEMLEQLLGRWAGGLAAFLYLFGFLLFLSASQLRVLGDFMATHIMPNTPVQFIYLLFIIVAVRAVRSGIETIARTAETAFPWVMFLLGILVLFVIPQSRITRLEPVLMEGMKPVIAGMYTFIAYGFMESGAFYMVFPFVNESKKVRRAAMIGTGAGGVILVTIVYFCLTVFGPVITKDALYPSYMLAKKIELGEFLQRIEVLMAIAWLFTLFFKLTVTLYGTCLGAAQLFRLRDYRLLTLPLGMILMVLPNLLAPNVIDVSEVGKVYPLFDFTCTIGLTVILLLARWVKRKLAS